MKKKLLILSMFALLVCIFAISASATTIYKDANDTELFRYETFQDEDDITEYFGFSTTYYAGIIKSYEGSFPKTNADGKELAWYVTGTTTDESGNTIISVACGTTVGDVGYINSNGAYNFNTGYSKDKIVSINFPDNAGITAFGFGTFGGYSDKSIFPKASTNLLFIYCPNTLTSLGGGFIQSLPVLICEIDDETPATEIGATFAHDARNLREINIPASVTKINGESNGSAFIRNYMLEKVTFAPNSNLTTMANYCFSWCISLTEIKLPNSLTQIGGRCFENCKNLEKVYLGASLAKTTNVSSFRLCPKLKICYVPSTFTTMSQYTFNEKGPADTVIFFAGNRTQFNAFYQAAVDGKNNERITSGYKEEYIVEWDSSNADSYYLNLATAENHKLYVINYSPCEAFYDGEHTTGEASCTRCGKIIYCDNPEHNFEISISYESFVNEGVKTARCLDCNSATMESKVPALFESKGYSAPENGDAVIAIGFAVNKTALSEYASVTNSSVSYGLFAVLKDKLKENDIFTADGVAAEGVVYADITKHAYSLFELKIVGIKDTQKNVKIAFGTYVSVTDDKGTKYSYIQPEEPEANEKYYFASFNDIYPNS